MKGEVINYRQQDGTWVSGYFIPDNSTQVSLGSRKYYNYCRNDSSSVYAHPTLSVHSQQELSTFSKNALAWDESPEDDVAYVNVRNQQYGANLMSQTMGANAQKHEYSDNEEQYGSHCKLQRHKSETDMRDTSPGGQKGTVNKDAMGNQGQGQRQGRKEQTRATQERSRAKRPQSVAAVDPATAQAERQRRQERLAELQGRKDKSVERIKIEEYIKNIAPYTRQMSNTRFRTFFDKQCMQGYGRKNTNQPIGGVIYGNHLKTFNINPHSKGNNPKNYQTHQTAINYGKRTKLNEEAKWKRLEKEFTKKLGLKDRNESVPQGKNAVVQQVNELNMHAIMNSNNEFARQHRDEIRAVEKEMEADRQAAIDNKLAEFKAQKQAERHAFNSNPLAISGNQTTNEMDSMPLDDRLRSKVVYKLVDADGNVRYGTDRHALTCFVDMNFPENDKAYTEHLKQRMPIFPTPVHAGDMYLDEIRKQNYVDSVVNGYPAHYLVPNVDYSQVNWGVKTEAERRDEQARAYSREKQRQVEMKNQGAGATTATFANTEAYRKQQAGSMQAKQTSLGATQSPSREQRQQQQRQTIQKKPEQGRRDQPRSQGDRGKQIQDANYQPQKVGRGQGGCQCRCNCRCEMQGGILMSKQAMIERASRDPEYAHKIVNFSKKYQSGINNNAPQNTRDYDPSRYFVHPVHELNPRVQRNPEKIPYAGVPSAQF